MADEEMPARLQMVMELGDQLRLRRPVKVDHHVAAENQIERGFDRKVLRHQVNPLESNHFAEMRFHLDLAGVLSAASEEMPTDLFRIEAFDLFEFVNTVVRFSQNTGREIGCQDLAIP